MTTRTGKKEFLPGYSSTIVDSECKQRYADKPMPKGLGSYGLFVNFTTSILEMDASACSANESTEALLDEVALLLNDEDSPVESTTSESTLHETGKTPTTPSKGTDLAAVVVAV